MQPKTIISEILAKPFHIYTSTDINIRATSQPIRSHLALRPERPAPTHAPGHTDRN